MPGSLARGTALAGAALAGVVAHDLRRRQHAILRNFPSVGHFRYLLESVRACGGRHPALIDPDRIEIVSQRYGSAPLREGFGYEPRWPLISDERRAETEALIGAPAPRPAPGPEAGEHAGFPGAGDPGRPHMDARSAGGDTRAGG
jgi:hypothetical protein